MRFCPGPVRSPSTTPWLASLGLLAVLLAPGRSPGADRPEIERGLQDLTARLQAGRKANPDLADAEVFVRSVTWALRYDETLAPGDLALLARSLDRARARLAELARPDPAPSWTKRRGKVARGFVSEVDGSVQPYGIIVPSGYDPRVPARLDVVLHGSTRPVGMSEARFLSRFDEGDGPAASPPDAPYLELHPLGRVENGYRWAGETDVFEAIAAASKAYNVDPDRIVLRGMSMGASGTWHLGLKNPDRFVALGPYCGYVDTIEFSKTPLPTFIPVGNLPPHQARTLHLLDSVDYAANAGVVPVVACMGEKDVFFQAHEIMARAMKAEGLTLLNLISPGTGHVIDPVTQAEQLRRIEALAGKGLDRNPPMIRFVTWSLRYARCHWIQILALGQHYRRAEVVARRAGEGLIDVDRLDNIDRFAILPPASNTLQAIRIGQTTLRIPPRSRPGPRPGLAFARDPIGTTWTLLGDLDQVTLTGKRPGLQGPIDDAFREPFLIVKPTGQPLDPLAHAWAEAERVRFARTWAQYFRGDPRIKNDTDVTPDDARRYHLILFGDPGSNAQIARLLPKLPASWNANSIAVGTASVPAKGHALRLIHPNPDAPSRYVVLNSGHTFGRAELSSLNYLLFPRLGDWALVHAEGAGHPIQTGFFDEQWKPLPTTP